MAEDLEDRFFDILLRTLNYSIEFASEPSYASLRFMDLFSSLVGLQSLVEELSRDQFYEKLGEKIKDRELIRDQKTRSKLQTELLEMFVNEWKRRTGHSYAP